MIRMKELGKGFTLKQWMDDQVIIWKQLIAMNLVSKNDPIVFYKFGKFFDDFFTTHHREPDIRDTVEFIKYQMSEKAKRDGKKVIKESKSNFDSLLNNLISDFIKVAQEVYDDWEQDEEGYSEEYAAGGICDDIASAICEVLDRKRIDCTYFYNEYDYHTSAYAYDINTKELFKVDIPPWIYEEGAGYTWRKLPGIRFNRNHIIIGNESDLWDDWFEEDASGIYSLKLEVV